MRQLFGVRRPLLSDEKRDYISTAGETQKEVQDPLTTDKEQRTTSFGSIFKGLENYQWDLTANPYTPRSVMGTR